jgi:hypothetical protein
MSGDKGSRGFIYWDTHPLRNLRIKRLGDQIANQQIYKSAREGLSKEK